MDLSYNVSNVSVYDEDLACYCNLKINMLEREIYKITKKGGLTEEDDLRLTEIDTELEYWYNLYESNLIYEISDNYDLDI